MTEGEGGGGRGEEDAEDEWTGSKAGEGGVRVRRGDRTEGKITVGPQIHKLGMVRQPAQP